MTTNDYTTKLKKIIAQRVKESLLLKATLPDTPIDLTGEYATVWVPRGLNLKQWDKLLKKTCNGLWYWSGYDDSLSYAKGWEVRTILNTDKPTDTKKTYSVTADNTLIETYLALQWNRLELGMKPVDSETWSWLNNEEANFGLDGYLPDGSWLPDDGQVALYRSDAGLRYDLLGGRPAGRGSNSELEPSLPLVPSVVVEELTFNGRKYRLVED